MNKRLYFILILSVLFILGISAVSAEDNGDITTMISDVSADGDMDLSDSDMDLLSVEDISTGDSDDSSKLEKSNDEVILSNNTTSTQTLKTTISPSKTSVAYNSYLTVLLKDSSGNAVKSKNVKVVINKKSYTATTNSNGQAKVLLKIAPGQYTAKFTFNGDSSYKKSSTSSKIKITKAKPVITASNKAFKRSVKTKKYTVTLKNNRGTVMKKVKLTLKVNSKTYTAKTNSKGIATFKITKLTKNGNYKAKIKYSGSTYFKAITKTVKITVKTKSLQAALQIHQAVALLVQHLTQPVSCM